MAISCAWGIPHDDAGRRGGQRVGTLAAMFLILGALAAALAVGAGAFGAHGLRRSLSAEMLEVFQTAVQYHMAHALGLVLVGLAVLHFPASGPLRLAGWLMLAGIVLFSGSLYLLVLTGQRWLGAVTPFGGTAFILAWVLVAVAVWRAG